MANYPETTIPAIFQNRAALRGETACVGYKNSQGNYEDISWTRMNSMLKNLAYYLLEKGVKPNDKVALFSANRYEWWLADQAILSIGAVNVPIYATDSAEEARYIIEHSDSKICFVGDNDQLQRVLNVRDKLPQLEEIIIFDQPQKTTQGVSEFSATLDYGMANENPDLFEKRLTQLNPWEMATIIYTSGTTGNPKGVMLSHANMVANAKQVYAHGQEILDARPHTLLSFLPLSHSFERSVGYNTPVYANLAQPHKVVFAEDFAKILDNFQEVRPSFVVSVPRLYEKIHSGITAKVSQAPPLKKALFGWAMSISRRNLPYRCNNRERSGLFAIEYKLAHKLIFSKLLYAIGMDRLQFAISGGGPLTPADAEFFLGMDIMVLEGFGLSETTPCTNANRPNLIKPGSVGPPMLDTLVKIGQGGEVLIKGPQVMLGYYKNEEATKEVMTADGYFRTGDIGEIDKDGYLKITGRIKELIVTSGGKNISPQNIENSLKTSTFIEQVAVIGDNRKYLSALIVPNFDELEAWAAQHAVDFNSRPELIQNQQVIKLYEKEIDKYTHQFARVEQIRRFRLLDQEWSQATDELTPTLKLKRRVINEKFQQQIEAMYAD